MSHKISYKSGPVNRAQIFPTYKTLQTLLLLTQFIHYILRLIRFSLKCSRNIENQMEYQWNCVAHAIQSEIEGTFR